MVWLRHPSRNESSGCGNGLAAGKVHPECTASQSLDTFSVRVHGSLYTQPPVHAAPSANETENKVSHDAEIVLV